MLFCWSLPLAASGSAVGPGGRADLGTARRLGVCLCGWGGGRGSCRHAIGYHAPQSSPLCYGLSVWNKLSQLEAYSSRIHSSVSMWAESLSDQYLEFDCWLKLCLFHLLHICLCQCWHWHWHGHNVIHPLPLSVTRVNKITLSPSLSLSPLLAYLAAFDRWAWPTCDQSCSWSAEATRSWSTLPTWSWAYLYYTRRVLNTARCSRAVAWSGCRLRSTPPRCAPPSISIEIPDWLLVSRGLPRMHPRGPQSHTRSLTKLGRSPWAAKFKQPMDIRARWHTIFFGW